MNLNVSRSFWKGTVQVGVDASVADLKLAIRTASAGAVPLVSKLLCSGKQLKDDGAKLSTYGVVEGKSVMVMADAAPLSSASPSNATAGSVPSGGAGSGSSAQTSAAARQAEIERLAAAAATIGGRDETQWRSRRLFSPELRNQDGSPVRLEPAQQEALVAGMMLHAKGTHTLQQVGKARDGSAAGVTSTSASGSSGTLSSEHGTLSLALALFLRADEAFSRVSPQFLALIDNPPRLWLDIVWLYYRLGDMGHLQAAESYLRRAEEGFTAAHGPNLGRLLQLKGPVGSAPDRMLYVRLHALQGVLLALRGRTSDAMLKLQQAMNEARAFAPQDADLSALLSMGYTYKRALSALRTAAANALAASGPQREAWSVSSAHDPVAHEQRVQQAVGVAMEAQAREETLVERTRRERVKAQRARACGPTVSGQTMNMELVDALCAQLGLEEGMCVEAVRQSDSDQAMAVRMLTVEGGVEILLQAILKREQAKEDARVARVLARKQRQLLAALGSVGIRTGAGTDAAAASAADPAGVALPVQAQQDDAAGSSEEEDAESEEEADTDEAVFELAEALASGRAEEERWLCEATPLAAEEDIISQWLGKLSS